MKCCAYSYYYTEVLLFLNHPSTMKKWHKREYLVVCYYFSSFEIWHDNKGGHFVCFPEVNNYNGGSIAKKTT